MLAERAAWDFVADLPPQEKIELATINPGFILGPNLNEATFTSGDFLKGVLLGTQPGLPRVHMPMVDVREVADAHLFAILKPEANGHRFLMVSESIWLPKLGMILKEAFGKDGYPTVTTNTIAKPLVWMASWFDNDADDFLQAWGRERNMDTTPARDLLDIRFRPIRISAVDMAVALINSGYIKDQRLKK